MSHTASHTARTTTSVAAATAHAGAGRSTLHSHVEPSGRPRAVGVGALEPLAADVFGRLGTVLLRYGLVGILVLYGVFKWAPTEAAAIEPLVANSPLTAWLYAVTDLSGASRFIGAVELVVAALIALRPWAPRASALGSVGAAGVFLTTLSFMVTTPGTWMRVDGFVVPSGVGGFLIKDVFLLAAALHTAGEALRAARRPRDGGPEAPPAA